MSFDYLVKNISHTKGGVPKIIHQIWINEDPNIPEKWKQTPIEWKKNHPDWKYILWSGSELLEYITEYHPDFLELYNSYPYTIQRADMVRYFILYDFGGIYCDLDNYPTENLEKYLTNNIPAYFVHSPNGVIINSLMISQKGAGIFLEIQDALKPSSLSFALGKHMVVYLSTGPFMMTSVLRNSNLGYSILPRRKFNPYKISEIGTIKKNTSMMTLKGQSWNGMDSKIFNFILEHSIPLAILSIIFILIIVFGVIYYFINYYRFRNLSCKKVVKYCTSNSTLGDIKI
jgi:mannosyltransferase OCH1-like enzyme